jgi:hypothetical protein
VYPASVVISLDERLDIGPQTLDIRVLDRLEPPRFLDRRSMVPFLDPLSNFDRLADR